MTNFPVTEYACEALRQRREPQATVTLIQGVESVFEAAVKDRGPREAGAAIGQALRQLSSKPEVAEFLGEMAWLGISAMLESCVDDDKVGEGAVREAEYRRWSPPTSDN